MDYDSDSDYHPHRSILMRADINILELLAVILAIIVGILFHICVWILMVPVRTLRSLFMLLGNFRDELAGFAAMGIPAGIRVEEDEEEDTAFGDGGTDVGEETIVKLEMVAMPIMDADKKAVGDEWVSINGTGSSWAQVGRIRRSGM